MKRILLLVLAAACLLSLVGCQSEPSLDDAFNKAMGGVDQDTVSRMHDIIDSDLP